jgi:tight adherence protein B
LNTTDVHGGGDVVALDATISATPRLDLLAKRLLPFAAKAQAGLQLSGRNVTVGQYGAGVYAIGGSCIALLALAGVPPLIALATGLTAGVGIPWLLVKRAASKRLASFTSQFPEAIDLIVRALRAGLPLGEALNTVGREFPEPAGGEFRRVSGSLSVGIKLDDALWAMARRIDSAELRFFIISVSTQQQTGGNLGETLANLADILRSRAQMRLKVKAMTGEARMSAMVLGCLPFAIGAIMALTNPDYIAPLVTDPRGWMMLGVGAVMLTVGVGIMAKLVSFEI